MLSDFQQKKLRYFFGLLDADGDGILERQDFLDIAEDLCINLGYRDGSEEQKQLTESSIRLFYKLLKDISHEDSSVIRTDEWVAFFDHLINKGDQVRIIEYCEIVIGFLFDLFDENHDGFISTDEYVDLFVVYGIDIKYSGKSYTYLDINHDGLLSKDEVMNSVETFLTSDDQEAKGNWVFGNWEMIARS